MEVFSLSIVQTLQLLENVTGGLQWKLISYSSGETNHFLLFSFILKIHIQGHLTYLEIQILYRAT